VIGSKIEVVGQNGVVRDPEDLIEGCHENHAEAYQNRARGDRGDDDEGDQDQGVIFRGSDATGFPPIVVNFFPSSR